MEEKGQFGKGMFRVQTWDFVLHGGSRNSKHSFICSKYKYENKARGPLEVLPGLPALLALGSESVRWPAGWVGFAAFIPPGKGAIEGEIERRHWIHRPPGALVFFPKQQAL